MSYTELALSVLSEVAELQPCSSVSTSISHSASAEVALIIIFITRAACSSN